MRKDVDLTRKHLVITRKYVVLSRKYLIKMRIKKCKMGYGCHCTLILNMKQQPEKKKIQ